MGYKLCKTSDDDVHINRDWEIIKEKIKISEKRNPGYIRVLIQAA
jgi:hypothetical protein